MSGSTTARSGQSSRYRHLPTCPPPHLPTCPQVLSEHTAMATGVRFGGHSQFLASTSMDRTLKVYGSQ